MAKLLVVEDDALTLKNVSTVLSHTGHEVRQAPDGADALRLLEKESFDLVITDIVMPRVNGIEVAEFVQSTSPSTPVLFMTGTSQLGDKIGSLYVLIKPFRLDDLLSRVEVILGEPSGMT